MTTCARVQRPNAASGSMAVTGWLAVVEQPKVALIARVAATLATLMETVPRRSPIGVDISIGLPESGARLCELEAHQRLGRPRMSSVFPLPPPACLAARDYEEACAILVIWDGRMAVGAQI
jgi:predicted RNase H-like nuclease